MRRSGLEPELLLDHRRVALRLRARARSRWRGGRGWRWRGRGGLGRLWRRRGRGRRGCGRRGRGRGRSGRRARRRRRRRLLRGGAAGPRRFDAVAYTLPGGSGPMRAAVVNARAVRLRLVAGAVGAIPTASALLSRAPRSRLGAGIERVGPRGSRRQPDVGWQRGRIPRLEQSGADRDHQRADPEGGGEPNDVLPADPGPFHHCLTSPRPVLAPPFGLRRRRPPGRARPFAHARPRPDSGAGAPRAERGRSPMLAPVRTPAPPPRAERRPSPGRRRYSHPPPWPFPNMN
jgi:hypothetical protein